MEINYLRDFICIAQLGSLSKAADLKDMSQPAMSHILSVVEAFAGTKLFDRVGRSLQLNKNGKLFLDAAMESLSILDNTVDLLHNPTKKITGKISVAIISLHPVFPELITRFCQLYPDVEISVTPEYDENELNSSICDVCFLSQPNQNHDLIGHRIFSEKVFLVVTKTHHLADRQSVPLKDLENESWAISPRRRTREEIINMCIHAGFTPKIGLEIGSLSLQKAYIMLRQGITLWPESLLSHAEHNLAFISVDDDICKRTYEIAWWKNKRQTLAMKVFIDFADRYCQIPGNIINPDLLDIIK